MTRAVSLWGLAELTRNAADLPALLLLQSIVTDTVINTKTRSMVDAALLVRDDVGDEQWEAVCLVLRKRRPRWELPLYEKTKSGWRYVRVQPG